MHPTRLLAICLIASAPGAALKAASPGLVLAERHAEFGDRYQGSTVEQRYVFTNTGATPVRVIETIVVDGTGDVSVTPTEVAPGGDLIAVVRQPLARQLGRTSFRYALVTDEPGVDRYRFALSGFVQSAYDPETLTVEFGVVDRSAGGTADLEVSSREVESLEVLRVVGLAESIDCEVLGRAGPAGQGQTLRATLAAGMPPGLLSGSFTLVTNVAHQPELQVFYRANVVGDVVPSENPVQLGVTRIGEVLRKEVRLESRTGRPFEVENVADSAGLFAWSVDPCEEPHASCRRLVLELAPDAASTLAGTLRVNVAGEDVPITLNYRGIVVTPSTVIKKIEVPGNPEGLRP